MEDRIGLFKCLISRLFVLIIGWRGSRILSWFLGLTSLFTSFPWLIFSHIIVILWFSDCSTLLLLNFQSHYIFLQLLILNFNLILSFFHLTFVFVKSACVFAIFSNLRLISLHFNRSKYNFMLIWVFLAFNTRVTHLWNICDT